MHKRTMIFVIAVVLVAAVVLVCVIPRFTKVDVTLNATKIGAQGEPLGTYEIFVRGYQLDYISGESALDVSISPFDDLTGFKPSSGAGTGTKGSISTAPGTKIFYVIYSASNTAKDDVALCELGFSPDLDRWIFLNNTDKIYYVASASGAHTTQELVEYFSILIPSNWTSD